MATQEMRQIASLQARQEFRLLARLEQTTLLEMPEAEFSRLIAEIEKAPLFQKLFQKEKVIRYQRFAKTDISPSFYQPNKVEALADAGSFEVDSLLQNKEHVLRLAQKIGVDRFKQYFLYPAEGLSPAEIAQACHLEIAEVQEINRFIDEFAVRSEFYHPSTLRPEPGLRYTKVASVERGPEGFVLGYFPLSLARGRYVLNYEKFEAFTRTGALGKAEAREARQLLRKLELINTRKDTVNQILQHLVEKQTLYFESGVEKALLPFTQKALAEKLGLPPSTICRAISGKSLSTPWGEEKPLKDFFPRPRRFKRELLKQLLETEAEPLSDQALQARLHEQCGVSLSRRSVARLRKELKVAPAWQRKRVQSLGAPKEQRR